MTSQPSAHSSTRLQTRYTHMHTSCRLSVVSLKGCKPWIQWTGSCPEEVASADLQAPDYVRGYCSHGLIGIGAIAQPDGATQQQHQIGADCDLEKKRPPRHDRQVLCNKSPR
jgi:hypothetical protein